MKGEISDDEDGEAYDPAKDTKDDGNDVDFEEDAEDDEQVNAEQTKGPIVDHAAKRKRT
jgi:hypothetical protein